MKMQEGALPPLGTPPTRVKTFFDVTVIASIGPSPSQHVADRRDCRADQRFAAGLSCYYQKRLSLAHSNTVSSATALTVAPLNAYPASAKRVTCFRSLGERAKWLLMPESCVRVGHRRICKREYRSDNGKT